jgi:hypothetical protein
MNESIADDLFADPHTRHGVDLVEEDLPPTVQGVAGIADGMPRKVG